MTAPATAATPPLSARAVLLLELALAMGGFAIGTGEFAIMGLMPNVAEGLGISEPQVGNVISTYALGVVVGAPLLAILGSRLFRRHLLLLLMGFFALGNFASALAPDYSTLMIFRFITGLPHGAYFGVAMLVAASMVPPDRRAQVTSPLFTDTKSNVGSTSYVTVKDTYPKLVPTSATKWHSAEFGYGSSRSGAVGDERNSPVGLVSVVVPRQVASEQSAPP